MTTKQRFGGPWTVEKLGILSDYIGFYATALKKQPFDILYIDAFAGTGKIEIGDEEEFEIIDGSAKLALQADGDFAEYIFIESKKAYPTPNIIQQDLAEILAAVGFADKIIFGRLHYNKTVTAFYGYREFYNNCANQVIAFCSDQNIAYHIKNGTITK